MTILTNSEHNRRIMEAYEAGQNAAYCGKPVSENPYSGEPDMWDAWLDGHADMASAQSPKPRQTTPQSRMTLRKALCAIGLHDWRDGGDALPYVWIEACTCCAKRRSGWAYY